MAASIVDPRTDPDWDAKVAAFPNATTFHTAAWARVLTSTYRYTPVYSASIHDGRLNALVPMMEVDSWITGRRGVALPFTDFCAPLGDDPVAIALCRRHLESLASQRHWSTIEYRGASDPSNESASCRYYSHDLDLAKPQQALWEACASSVRRAVRKAEKSALRLEFSSSREALDDFRRLHALTRRRHGAPVQPARFFENLHRHVLEPGLGFVANAYADKRPAASLVFLRHGPMATFKFSASDTNLQHLRGNNLLLWRSICHLQETGCTGLNFGRTSMENEGLRRFKLGWGTTEHSISYLKYHVRTGRPVRAPDPSLGWRSRLFRMVPSPLAQVIGTFAYRHFG